MSEEDNKIMGLFERAVVALEKIAIAMGEPDEVETCDSVVTNLDGIITQLANLNPRDRD